jgi:hypothetical protein
MRSKTAFRLFTLIPDFRHGTKSKPEPLDEIGSEASPKLGVVAATGGGQTNSRLVLSIAALFDLKLAIDQKISAKTTRCSRIVITSAAEGGRCYAGEPIRYYP